MRRVRWRDCWPTPTPRCAPACRYLRRALHDARALEPPRLAELDRLIDALDARPAMDAEADDVQLFDRGRATSLHLFEHVHGDSRDRGPAMVDLAKTYAGAGLFLAADELPDYLPVVLEFASTRPPSEARAFLAETAHIFNAIFRALSAAACYASVLGAVLEVAGEKAAAVKLPADEPLDASWEEPPVFEGCSSRGQASPASRTNTIVRKTSQHEEHDDEYAIGFVFGVYP